MPAQILYQAVHSLEDEEAGGWVSVENEEAADGCVYRGWKVVCCFNRVCGG